MIFLIMLKGFQTDYSNNALHNHVFNPDKINGHFLVFKAGISNSWKYNAITLSP